MTTQVIKPPVADSKADKRIWSNRLEQWGYYSLLLLAIVLPFELTQIHIIKLPPFFTLSNLELVFYICAILAGFTLLLKGWEGWQAGTRNPGWLYWLFGGLIGWCLVSSGLGSFFSEGVKWTLGIAMGGVFALAIPYWFKTNQAQKLMRLCIVLVITGTISAGIGWMEFVIGSGFADSLGWFKVRPTSAGPYLRLSGTFEYANIAAQYYEMMLPLAIAGLAISLQTNLGHLITGRNPTATTFLQRVGAVAKIGLWVAAIVILFEAILLTFSRAALFGTIAAMAVIGLAWLVVKGWRKVWAVAVSISVISMIVVTAATWMLQPVMGLRFTSQSDQDWYRAAFQATPPVTMSICQEIRLPVRVTNQGPLLWEAGIKRPYAISYHWLLPDGMVFQFEGIRSTLPSTVSTGNSVVINTILKAPDKPGSYLLVWDMVQEDVSWFSLKSASYQSIPMQISDLPPDEAKIVCMLAPGEQEVRDKPAPKELPKVLLQPNRDQLWATAIEMVKAKPIFGVGPDNYRLVYGNYSSPKLKEWDERIFANNTPLELAAGIGIVGTVLFSLFALGLMWRNLVSLTRPPKQVFSLSQVLLVGVLAALAAFTVHGILDYFFGSRPIFYIMWLVLGLFGIMWQNLGGGFASEIGKRGDSPLTPTLSHEGRGS